MSAFFYDKRKEKEEEEANELEILWPVEDNEVGSI